MIFRLVVPDTVSIPITLSSPDGETGTILVKLRYLRASETKALVREAFGLDDAGEPAREPAGQTWSDFELTKRVVVGWERLGDADGNEIAWSEQAFADAMDIPYFHDAVAMAVVDHLVGGRKKNSMPLVDNGPEESTT